MNKKDDKIFYKYTQGVEPINRKNKIKKGVKKIPKNIVKQLQRTKKTETNEEIKTENKIIRKIKLTSIFIDRVVMQFENLLSHKP